jgi:hypothetical protein
MPRKPGNGRLKPVSVFTEPRHFAHPRGNIWEISLSPEKSPFKSRESLLRVPLKITKKSRAAEAPSEDYDSLFVPEDGDKPGLHGNIEADDHEYNLDYEAPMHSSSPGGVQALEEMMENDVQIEEFTSKGATRCAEVSYRCDKPAGPRYEQCRNAAKKSNDGSRCGRHLQNPGSIRCEHIIDQDGQKTQCLMPGVKGSNSCPRHTKLDILTRRRNHKRKSADDQDVESRLSKSPRLRKNGEVRSTSQVEEPLSKGGRQQARDSSTQSQPAVQIPARRGGPPRQRSAGSKTVSDTPIQDGIAESIETTASASPRSKGRTKSQPQSSNISTANTRRRKLPKCGKPAKARETSEDSHPEDEPLADDGQGEESQDGEDIDGNDNDEAELEEEEDSAKDAYTPKLLARVLEYLELEKRSGICQTEFCRKIKSACDTTGTLIRKHNPSSKEVNQKLETVQAMLRTVRAVTKDHHAEVKADMYGYVFRSLAKLLASLFKHFSARDEDFTKSLRPILILFPFVHDIIALKDLLASWKVTVPQRYSGDRLVADVNSLLISPLRDLETLLNRRLSQLELSERNVERLADLEQKIEEEEMEAARKHEVSQSRNKRWRRWQDLHIARMECEPDPRRRKYLTIIKLEDLEEKDANGVVFERVPVFKDRNSTPSRWPSSTATARPWLDEQILALMDCLEKFAGNFPGLRMQARSLTY